MTTDNASQNKKLQILDAATTLLTNRGLQTLSFDAIAKQAGMSRQLVRYYYTDLDLLVSDLCDHLGKVYQEILIGGIMETKPAQRLDFFLDFFFGTTQDYPMPDNLEAYDALFAYAAGSKDVKQRLRVKYRTLGQVVQHELAIVHPELSATACDELSFLFVSMMHAHWSYVATLGFSQDYNRVARNAMSRLITSYLETPPSAPAPEPSWMRAE